MKLGKQFYILLIIDSSIQVLFSFFSLTLTYQIMAYTDSSLISGFIIFISIIGNMIGNLSKFLFNIDLSPKNLLIISNIIQIIILILIFVLFSKENLIIIFILQFILSYFSGISLPVIRHLIQKSLSEENRDLGVSILSSCHQFFMFSSWLLGGFLVSLFKYKLLLFTIFLLFIVLIFSVILDDYPKQHLENEMKKNPLSKLKTLKKYKLPCLMMFIEIIETLFSSVWVGSVSLKFVSEIFGNPSMWGYINAFSYLGKVLGGLIIIKFLKNYNERTTIYIFFLSLGYSFTLLLFSISKIDFLSLSLIFFCGLLVQTRDILEETIYFAKIPSEIFTEFMSFKYFFTQFAFLISIFLIGYCVDLIGAQKFFMLASFLLMFTSLLYLALLYRINSNSV